jgi:hypothetical protein
MESRSPHDPRDESQAQRDDRNLAELLQELRVAGLGVQVLFGFLLSLPFTQRFSRLSHVQRELAGLALPRRDQRQADAWRTRQSGPGSALARRGPGSVENVAHTTFPMSLTVL